MKIYIKTLLGTVRHSQLWKQIVNAVKSTGIWKKAILARVIKNSDDPFETFMWVIDEYRKARRLGCDSSDAWSRVISKNQFVNNSSENRK